MKTVQSEQFGEIRIARRKGTKRMVLRIDPEGQVKVTAPKLVPDRAILAFVQSKADWIQEQQSERSLIADEDMVAHKYVFRFVKDPVESVKSRVLDGRIIITMPYASNVTDPDVQKKARSAAQRLLKKEAQAYLTERIATLAATHELPYSSLAFKRLRSRWGSCSPRNDIVLNTHLMNLPHHLIDHVILHELAHTQHLDHQADFWALLESLDPYCAQNKKSLKGFDASKPVMA